MTDMGYVRAELHLCASLSCSGLDSRRPAPIHRTRGDTPPRNREPSVQTSSNGFLSGPINAEGATVRSGGDRVECGDYGQGSGTVSMRDATSFS